MKGIITADWHIRSSVPRCRRDSDWMATQKKALDAIMNKAFEYNCDVYIVGDIFHSNADASFECISMIQHMADELSGRGLFIRMLAGNHDLPFHSARNIDRSAVGILLNTRGIIPIDGPTDISAPNFGEPVDETKPLVFEHRLVFPDKTSLPPNVEAITADDLLAEHYMAEWIFTGDYHHAFHVDRRGRHVVNPGCILRQAADMKDYQCGFFYVDTDNDIVRFHTTGDNDELVDDSYLIKQEEREQRLEDFMDKLRKTKSISLDFIENVEKAIMENKLSNALVDTIHELVESGRTFPSPR